MYDLIIAGAGPAGATLARLLGRQRSILLLDARDMREDAASPPREKCCGGLLAPDARKMLDSFGLALPESVADSRQPLAVRALDLVSGRSRLYPRQYINMDRAAFERWLLSLLPGEVVFRGGERFVSASPLRHSSGWEVRVRNRDGERAEQGAMLVGADGANSAVRRLLCRAARPACRYLAVQDEFEAFADASRSGEYLAFFHPGVTDFYGWAIPKRNRTLLGIALPPARRRAKPVPELMRAVRRELERHGHVFAGEGERHACLVLRPGPGDVFAGRDAAFCIGEAGGFISPSSAEGFSYAFASASALAEAVRRHAGPERVLRAYRNGTAGLRLNILGKNVKSRIMYSPRLRDAVMRSGALAAREVQ